jgi:predicted NUDIX family NTP pyrophosphohydrolase
MGIRGQFFHRRENWNHGGRRRFERYEKAWLRRQGTRVATLLAARPAWLSNRSADQLERCETRHRAHDIFAHQAAARENMSTEISCGLLMYVLDNVAPLRVLLVHPGGPYWCNKDAGAWSIPKGLADPGEDLLAAAQREFTEETGLIAQAPFVELTPLKQKSGKIVHCWAFRGAAAATMQGKSTFEIEWPRGSGRMSAFPEVDEARLFPIDEAFQKILAGQAGFIRELTTRLVEKDCDLQVLLNFVMAHCRT